MRWWAEAGDARRAVPHESGGVRLAVDACPSVLMSCCDMTTLHHLVAL
jgi:hypothetical protein